MRSFQCTPAQNDRASARSDLVNSSCDRGKVGVADYAVGLGESLATPVAIGIIVGLVVGKPVGVLAGAWLTAR